MKNENRLTERVEIYSNEDVKVESAKLTLKRTIVQVAIKSSRRQEDEARTEVFRGRFINEIINYQLIKKRVKTCQDQKELEKLNYFADYVGFLMNDDKSNPIFGSIILMYYSLGDLQMFIHKNRFIKQITDIDPEPIDINQLIDFTKQIAIGLNDFLSFFTRLQFFVHMLDFSCIRYFVSFLS
jgi:hypothetical protein